MAWVQALSLVAFDLEPRTSGTSAGTMKLAHLPLRDKMLIFVKDFGELPKQQVP